MEIDVEIKKIIDLMIKDQDIRKKLASESLRLFFGTYMSHYVSHAIAPFHVEMFQLADDPNNRTIVIMGARNSAKSAIMNTALAIWSVLGKERKKFVIIASRTQVKAKLHFLNTRKELENNKLLRGDLGPFKTEESQWGSSIILSKYDAQITFASVEQSLRGMRHKQYRPDLLIADDIEEDDSVKTIDGRNKTYDWLTVDAIPAGDLQTIRVVLLGTYLHEDSVLMRFKKEIDDDRRSGVFRRYPLLDEDNNILWKGKYPDMAAIEAERKQIVSDRAWNHEFLLRDYSDQDRVIDPEMIHYYKDSDIPSMTRDNHYRGAFIGVDPALAENERAACTAMIVIKVFGWGDNMRMYVMPYPVNEKIRGSMVLEKIKALSSAYAWNGIKAKLYIENVGYQGILADLLDVAEYPAVGVHPLGDKRSRLGLIGEAIKKGIVQLPMYGVDDLKAQITNFGSERYKDLADALALVVTEELKNNKPYTPFPDQNSHNQTEPGEEDDFKDLRSITFGLRKKIF